MALSAQQRKRVAWLIDGYLADDFDEATFEGRWQRAFAAMSSPPSLEFYTKLLEHTCAQSPFWQLQDADMPVCEIE